MDLLGLSRARRRAAGRFYRVLNQYDLSNVQLMHILEVRRREVVKLSSDRTFPVSQRCTGDLRVVQYLIQGYDGKGGG